MKSLLIVLLCVSSCYCLHILPCEPGDPGPLGCDAYRRNGGQLGGGFDNNVGFAGGAGVGTGFDGGLQTDLSTLSGNVQINPGFFADAGATEFGGAGLSGGQVVGGFDGGFDGSFGASLGHKSGDSFGVVGGGLGPGVGGGIGPGIGGGIGAGIGGGLGDGIGAGLGGGLGIKSGGILGTEIGGLGDSGVSLGDGLGGVDAGFGGIVPGIEGGLGGKIGSGIGSGIGVGIGHGIGAGVGGGVIGGIGGKGVAIGGAGIGGRVIGGRGIKGQGQFIRPSFRKGGILRRRRNFFPKGFRRQFNPILRRAIPKRRSFGVSHYPRNVAMRPVAIRRPVRRNFGGY